MLSENEPINQENSRSFGSYDAVAWANVLLFLLVSVNFGIEGCVRYYYGGEPIINSSIVKAAVSFTGASVFLKSIYRRSEATLPE